MTSQQQQVFISYQRTDGDFAARVREHLVAHGVRTWMDLFDIPVGAYWPDEIDKGLTGSDIVIGILSPDAVESRNVKNEWDWAIQNDKRLLLLQVISTVLPHRYVSINFIDASGPDQSRALMSLLATLGVTPVDERVPETRYANSDGVNIAYQVVGDGPVDLVWVPGFVSNIEIIWEHPLHARYLRRLASFSRLILFDKRGTGASDRVKDVPILEQRMEDLRIVMDAAGSRRAVVMGNSEGGPLSVLFASTYPAHVMALILYGSFACGMQAPGYPHGRTLDENQQELELFQLHWGDESIWEQMAPGAVVGSHYSRWAARYARLSASPNEAVALARLANDMDVRGILPTVRVPTLVLHRTGDRSCKVGEGRYLAEHIPGARFVELPGDDHVAVLGDQDAILDEVEAFVAALLDESQPETVLATALVVSGAGNSALGHDMLERFKAILDHFRGQTVGKATELTATFDGPARAIRAASAILDAGAAAGNATRAALHTGEVEDRGSASRGLPLDIAGELSTMAAPGEILVTSTVKDLVVGSGIRFEEREPRSLAGLPDEWRVFAVDRSSVAPPDP
ncbi:MAG TPA: alpha/beta fold hydrolase [Thermomicrobiales bacterium]|nr:alpha/beta fold hydrolase [Thermomicrobiales bacterium]